MTSRLGFCLCSVMIVGLVGCGGSSKREPQPTEVSLQKLAIVYGQYVGRHEGKTPANEEEFRKYLQAMSDEERKRWGITDVSQLFQSPHDGQPYVVRYGVTLKPPGPDGVPWIAHEKEGKGGKRFIAFVTGQIQEADDARFQEIIKSK